MRDRTGQDEFSRALRKALSELPPMFHEALSNVAVVVEEWPPKELIDELEIPPDDTLYGFYHGVPLPERSVQDSGRRARGGRKFPRAPGTDGDREHTASDGVEDRPGKLEERPEGLDAGRVPGTRRRQVPRAQGRQDRHGVAPDREGEVDGAVERLPEQDVGGRRRDLHRVDLPGRPVGHLPQIGRAHV